jgi:exodeoxyribonuclease VII large subunit
MVSSQNVGFESSQTVLSVSQLTRRARILIEEHLGEVSVEGELSNLRRPGSGHWYFTLKDQGAQIRCAMFAGRNRTVRLKVTDGLQVRLTGRVSLYEPRGDFQLIVDRLEAAGEGALRAAFDALKQKLSAEGLFDESRKRPLPEHPRHLTIISSPSGAALRDVLHVVERRFPGLAVTVIPSAVQGDGAEAQLIRAIERTAVLTTDVVLLTRGGGSLEDLWSFNLEPVARAVAACPHPVVSAIGHQTDFAITDFVADIRAPTPSAAAEMITPTRTDLLADVDGLQARLRRAINQEIRYLGQAVNTLDARLLDPATQIVQKMVQVDELEQRLLRSQASAHAVRGARLNTLRRALGLLAPARQIAEHSRTVSGLSNRLAGAQSNQLGARQRALVGTVRALTAVSPLNTLSRGYAVLAHDARAADGRRRTITSVADAEAGSIIEALLADGTLTLSVSGIDPEPPLSTPDLNTPADGNL